MKNTLTKPTPLKISCGNEVVGLHLQPVTFRRLIEITASLDGMELNTVLLNPTPLQIVTIAYCMLNDEDKKKIDEFALVINNKAVKVSTIQKLYYMVTENNVQDGYVNYVAMIQAVNNNIQMNFPENPIKKKALMKKKIARWMSKKSMMLLGASTTILLMIFLIS